MNQWLLSFKAYLKPNLLMILPLGLVAGIPYGMIMDPLNYWLSKSGVDRSAIGLLALVFTIYSVKVAWSPLVDRFQIAFVWKIWPKEKLATFITALCIFLPNIHWFK